MSTPPIPSDSTQKRFTTRTEHFTSSTTLNWNHSRLVTPGESVGYITPLGLEFANSDIMLFRSGPDSQGLIKDMGEVFAASVSTSISSPTKRSAERKATHIQYEKGSLIQGEKDFEVNPVKHNSITARTPTGKANYESGHLIDHKFSAEGSHTTEENYIPELALYNSPTKEYLVQRSSAYVEIPLYTPNPPLIQVKGSTQNYHSIPIGIVFIQINNNEIDNIYYFPNNIKYETIKEKMRTRANRAINIISHFKLKRSLHNFFRCAVLVDINRFQSGKEMQEENEKQFFSLMDRVTEGMAYLDVDGEVDDIIKVATKVLHQSSEVDPCAFLDCTDQQWEIIQEEPLDLPFRILGEFMIGYGLKNVLKSEMLSIQSKLAFTSILIDFIEFKDQVGEEALLFIDGFAEEFESALEQLDQLKETMSRTELFFYANLYKRLSDQFNHIHEGTMEIYSSDLSDYFSNFIGILKYITKREDVQNLQRNAALQFLDLVEGAQHTFTFLSDLGYIEEEPELQDQGEFLYSLRESCQLLLKHTGSIETQEFQTNINRSAVKKSAPGYRESFFSNLGIPPKIEKS